MTPLRPPIRLAHKDVLGVKALQPWTIRVLVGHRIPDICLLVAALSPGILVISSAEWGADGQLAPARAAVLEDAGAAGGWVEGYEARLGLYDP